MERKKAKKDKMKGGGDDQNYKKIVFSDLSSDFQIPLKKPKKARKVAEVVDSESKSSGSCDRSNIECLESKSSEADDDDVLELPNKDPDMKKRCPVCSQDVRIGTYPSHLINCLKRFQRDESKPGCSRWNSNSKSVCAICNKDLSHMNETRRVQHMNKCLDNLEEFDSDSVTGSDSNSSILNCPLCFVSLSSQKARSSHLKQCAKNKGMTSKKLLEIVHLQERQADERKALGLSEMPPPQPRKKVVQKTRNRGTSHHRRHESASAVSDDMQVAMAMSLSTSHNEERLHKGDDRVAELLLGLGHKSKPQEIPSKKRRKKTDKTETPLLLLRSDEDRAAIIASRVGKILAEEQYGSMVNWKKVPPHRSILKQSPECRLWKLASLPRELTSDPSVFYVKNLEPFISPCKLKPGTKLKRLSEIPGYRMLTQPVNEMVEEEVIEDDVSCTLDVLCNLAKDGSTQIASQGFFTSEADEVNETKQSNNAYRNMVANDSLSDCIIELDDGTLIAGHRFPFYANCRMAYDEMDENGILRWDGISRPTAIAFLQFIYSSTIIEDDYSLVQLKSIANRYNLGKEVARVTGFDLEEQSPDPMNSDKLPLEPADFQDIDEQAAEQEMVVDDDDVIDMSATKSNKVHSQIKRKKVALELVKSPANRNTPNSSAAIKETTSKGMDGETPNAASSSRETNGKFCKRSLQFDEENVEESDKVIEPANCQHDISNSVFESEAVQGADQNDNVLSPNLFDEPFEDDDLFENLNLVGISQEKTTVTLATDQDHNDLIDAQQELRDTQCQQTNSVAKLQTSQSKSVSTSTPKDTVASHVDRYRGIRLSVSPVGQCRLLFINTRERGEITPDVPIANAVQHNKPVTLLSPSSSYSQKETTLEKNDVNSDSDSSNLEMASVTHPASHKHDIVVFESYLDEGSDKDDDDIVCGQYEKETDDTQTSKKRKFRQMYEDLDMSSSFSDVGPSSSLKRKRDVVERDKVTEENESPNLVPDEREVPSSGGFLVSSSSYTSDNNVWENFNDDGYYDSRHGMTASLVNPLPGTSRNSTPRTKRKSVTFSEVVQLVSPLDFSVSSVTLLSDNDLPDINSSNLSNRGVPPVVEQHELSPILGNKRKTKEMMKSKEKSKKKAKEKKGKAKLSVTPLPHYSVMPTPEIKKALSKIGVKAMPKKKASKLLKHVYYETHPPVSDDETEDLPDLVPSVNLEEEEETEVEKKKKMSPLEKSLNRENIKQFIKSHVHWHKDILQFKTIDINALMIDMRSANLKITDKKLKRYLDEQCITYTESRDVSPRKKDVSPRKKRTKKSSK